MMTSIKQVESYFAERDTRKLIRALGDKDLLIRRQAAKALGELEDPSAVPALAQAVSKNSDQYTIKNSLEALKRIGSIEAVDSLIMAFFSGDAYRSRLAEQHIKELKTPRAVDVLTIQTLILENNFAPLRAEPKRYAPILQLILQSEQYRQWPTGKRKQIGEIAVSYFDSSPVQKSSTRKDLADMGIFVAGVHDLSDLMNAVSSPTPTIRVKAAEKLGETSINFLRFPLRRQFKKEVKSSDDHTVSAAIAKALFKLGDTFGIQYFKQNLYQGDGESAAFAARALAEMRMEETLMILFDFAESPPPPPGYRNIAVVLNALEGVGPHAVDVILSQPQVLSPQGMVLLADLLGRVNYPEATVLLSDFAHSREGEVQDAAIKALIKLNSRSAAMTLRDLYGIVESDQIIDALARIAHPSGAQYLSAILPENTIFRGTLIDQKQQSVPLVKVRVVIDHLFGEKEGWGLKPISHEVSTSPDGAFVLSIPVFESAWSCYVKVTPLPLTGAINSEPLLAPISLQKAQSNEFILKLDTQFNHLIVTNQ